jgi:cytochrome c biogenesis protein
MASAAPKTSLTHSLALVWRTLRSMRTALILLLLLALASVAGSLLPQLPNSPERVASYLRDHGLWGTFLDRAGFFDVFGSWWFTLITVLLFVSLVACLIPRTRATWRALRSRPVQAREIDAFRHYAELTVPVEADVAYEVARRTMRRRRFRVAADPAARALAGEKGAAREVGSLLFHWAFILLLVGVIWGKGTGFTGYALIVEGDTWIDAQANYDGQIREGAFFGGNFTGIGVKLNSFESRFRNTGQPMDFVSNVELLAPDGSPIRTQDIRVNHPAQIDGLSIYQINWGWAPVIEVRDADGTLLTRQKVVMELEPVPTGAQGVPAFAMPWHGVVKVTSIEPQMAIDLELYPDSRAYFQQLTTGQPVAMLTEFDPVIRYTVWRGPILDPSPTTLDTTLMKKTGTGIVGAGRTSALESAPTAGIQVGQQLQPDETAKVTSLNFPALRRYSVLQVSRDRGVPIVLLAAILILLGLLPALYTSRRKVWVRVRPENGGAALALGGFALQRKPQFEEEFGKLVAAIAAAAGGGAAPATPREKVGAP